MITEKLVFLRTGHRPQKNKPSSDAGIQKYTHEDERCKRKDERCVFLRTGHPQKHKPSSYAGIQKYTHEDEKFSRWLLFLCGRTKVTTKGRNIQNGLSLFFYLFMKFLSDSNSYI